MNAILLLAKETYRISDNVCVCATVRWSAEQHMGRSVDPENLFPGDCFIKVWGKHGREAERDIFYVEQY